MALSKDGAGIDAGVPPVFLHLLIALGQIGLLTLLCASAGVFTDTDSTHEYYGHIFPGGALVAVGTLALAGTFSERKLTVIESWIGIAVWVIYLIGDIIQHPPAGIFLDLDHVGNQHIGIVTLVGVAGVLGLILVRRLTDLKGFHVIALVALLGFALPSHVHAGAPEMQSMSHTATGLFLVLGVLFRFFGRPVEYGASFICAGYLFFSGQTGLPVFADTIGQTPISWLCYWCAAGMLVTGLYLLVLRPPTVGVKA